MTAEPAALEALARRLFGGYADGDLEAVRGALAPDVVSHITNAAGGTDRVVGRDAFMARLPDTSEAQLEVAVTQVAVVDGERVMAMVEVRADRRGRSLHNFAAFLVRADASGEAARELWMVEALPAYSDEFWSP